MRMSNTEFNEAKRTIQETWHYNAGSKESYIRYMVNIIRTYDDGLECARRLDHYQTRYNISEYLK